MSDLRTYLFLVLIGPAVAAGCSDSACSSLDCTVTLTRTSCYGLCPDYTVVLSDDGALELFGGGEIVPSGRETRAIPARSAKRVFEVADSVRFFSIPSSIDKHCVTEATDMPETRLEVEKGSRANRVRERSCTTLRQIIRSLADSVIVKGSRIEIDSVLEDSTLTAWTREHEDRYIRKSYLDLVRRDRMPQFFQDAPNEIIRQDSIARDYLDRMYTVVNVVDSVTGARTWAEKRAGLK